MPPNHQHRSGSLRQSNKKNKRSKSSKRSVIRASGGRVNSSRGPIKSTTSTLSKADRVNQAKQRRDLKRLAIANKRRGLTGDGAPPTLVGVVTLSADGGNDEVRRQQQQSVIDALQSRGVTDGKGVCRFDNLKARIRFLTPSDVAPPATHANDGGSDNVVTAALELSRVCQSLVFVVMNAGTEQREDYIADGNEVLLTALKAQGLPGVSVVSVPTGRKSSKAGGKYLSRMMSAEFGDAVKVYECRLPVASSEEDEMEDDTPSSVKKAADAQLLALLRHLAIPSSPVKYWAQMPRSYIVSEGGCKIEKDSLVLTGWVRNSALNYDSLMHVPGIGTLNISKIQMGNDDIIYEAGGDSFEEGQQEGVMFANPDALEGEQNLIGFDHNDDDDVMEEESQEKMKDPCAPPMDHATAWMAELDPDNDEASVSRALSDAFNTNKSDALTDATNHDDDDEDDLEEESREKALREEEQFPDEVELTRTEKGRDRYARYRALKSFRKSFWDPMENLPNDYAKMFQFENFRGTQRDVLREVKEDIAYSQQQVTDDDNVTDDINMDDNDDDDNGSTSTATSSNECYIPINTPVKITLSLPSNTPPPCPTSLPPFVTATSLLPHENKASVLHIHLSPLENAPVIKSKDVLTFRTGFRSFHARPIFSHSNLNCDKHKYEKFLPPKGFCTATVYAPITYTPCPVLVFTKDGNTLVATGSIATADTRRIIVKRSILTGYPTRVHKRWATVKYMFYNPEDVRWFRPAGLTTKFGLKGHILESVGDHGTMKCLFDRPIKQHDTVCLALYKRVFPKFCEGGLRVW